MAKPVHDPSTPEGDRWVMDDFNKKPDVNLNIGIGYPF
jgi:hypothetical protein